MRHFLPVGKCRQDVFWAYQVIGCLKSVAVFDTLCYHYMQRAGSIMGGEFSLKRLDALEAKLLRIRYIQERYPGMTADAMTDPVFLLLAGAEGA